MSNADTGDLATEAPRRVFVTGAAGFIGRTVCHALADAGFEVIGLVRRHPSDINAVTGVRYVIGDVCDASSLSPDVLGGCHYVVHLIGIITEVRGAGQTFEAVHVQGTQNVLRAAKAAATRIERFVYLSAAGASPESPSDYARSKARAEWLVEASGLSFTIFRPSLVIGRGADFLRQIEGLVRRPPLSPFPLPFIPLPGTGATRFQPVDVGEMATGIVRSLTSMAADGKIFEIGGGSVVSFREIVSAVAERLGVKKSILAVPLPLMLAAASVLETLLPRPPLTVDQLIQLRRDNICDNGPVCDALTLDPLRFEESLDRVYPAAR